MSRGGITPEVMKVGEFELVDPVPEMRNTIAVSMLRPWIDVGRAVSYTHLTLPTNREV